MTDELAEKLNKWTIQSIQADRVLSGNGTGKAYKFTDLSIDLFVKIFSLVGDSVFNPQPEFHRHLRDSIVLGRSKTPPIDKNYAVKNLMSLRRVCSAFGDAINNAMKPGIDYDWVDVGAKIKGFKNNRCVTFFKYGGTGSQHPATYLTRIKRLNETPYEHLEKFERITRLWLVDMVLNEELFETLSRLDLVACEKIDFIRISGVKFAPDINVPLYVQTFLENINSSAEITFNSKVFDPNDVLFPGMLNKNDRDEMVFHELQLEEYHREFRTTKFHRNIRKSRMEQCRFRSLKLVNIALRNSVNSYQSHGRDENAQWLNVGNLYAALEKNMKNKSRGIKKAGKWHMKKVLALMDQAPIKKRNEVFYHLKQLKKIAGEGPLLPSEEKAIIDARREDIDRGQLLAHFPFLSNFSNVTKNWSEYKMEH